MLTSHSHWICAVPDNPLNDWARQPRRVRMCLVLAGSREPIPVFRQAVEHDTVTTTRFRRSLRHNE